MNSFLSRQFLFVPILRRLAAVASKATEFATSWENGEVKVKPTAATFRTPPTLEAALERLLKVKQTQMKSLKSKGTTAIGVVTVESTLGGMRSLPSLVCETSDLHPELGIRIRGLSIGEMLEKLPKPKNCQVPSSEAVLWLLLTGEVPSEENCLSLQGELTSPNRSKLNPSIIGVIDAMPDSHPMSQLISAVAAASGESLFAEAYRDGTMTKGDMWRVALNDGISLLAKLPVIAARIYKRSKGIFTEESVNVEGLDWAATFIRLMGFESHETDELMRLYMLLHADHEGGNVSAHASLLVSSALSDPYLAFASAMCGLAGPLHGLANQECLRWLVALREKLGDNWTADDVRAEAVATLDSGRVIPGYGHAVLRVTDPRFTAQKQFAASRLADDPLFKLLCVCVEVVPQVLQSSGKVRNPFPNVDCHSGVLLSHYGIVEDKFYTVLFGVSRAMGCISQLVWSRALGLPIERPKSLTLDNISEIVASKSKEF